MAFHVEVTKQKFHDCNRQHHSNTYFGIDPVAVLPVVRRAYVRSSYSRRLVSTPDGGTISLDWWNGSLENDLAADVPVLLCLHAFAGVVDIHMTLAILTESGVWTHLQ